VGRSDRSRSSAFDTTNWSLVPEAAEHEARAAELVAVSEEKVP